jgi:hypothetical protein
MKKVALLGTALVAGAIAVALFYPRGGKNAPLAFVPADTPYVFANLDPLGDATYKLLVERADKELPGSLITWRLLANDLAEKDPHVGDLMNAFIKELDGKHLSAIAQNLGLRLNGHSAVYGLGLSPVARFEISDASAFEAFLVRMEAAYGKPLETAKVGDVSYRRYVSQNTGMALVVGTVNGQAVLAVLAADVSESQLRLAFGLDRPAKSLQDDGRLQQLAKTKGYKDWLVGQVDIAQLLPLAASGTDPLYKSVSTAWMRAQTDEGDRGKATAYQVPEQCQSEIKRMAARLPAISLGYTRLDDKHQDMRIDVRLADDITKAFSGLSIDMPGLGAPGDAPLDVTIGVPIDAVRTFWQAQADAVAAAPLKCEMFTNLNQGFATVGEAVAKTAISPANEFLGVRFALDKIDLKGKDETPDVVGRVVLGTKNPEGLFAMAKMVNSELAKLEVKTDGKAVAIPADAIPTPLLPMAFLKAWVAMGPKALGVAIGTGQDKTLSEVVAAKGGNAGQIARMHITGDMYGQWLQVVLQKSLDRADDAQDDDELSPEEHAKANEQRALLKQQIETMKARFAAIKSIDSSTRVGSDGLVIDVSMEMK